MPDLTPSKTEFLKDISRGAAPLYMEIPYASPSDIYPGVSGPGSFLLESVRGPAKIARYSFIGFDPYMEFRIKDGIASIKRTDGITDFASNSPLSVLKNILTSYKQRKNPILPPFQGGAAGLLCYDFVHYLEKLPKTTIDDLKLPDADFLIVDKLIAFDHMLEKSWIIVCPGARAGSTVTDWPDEYEKAASGLFRIAEKTGKRTVVPRSCFSGDLRINHDVGIERYTDMVNRVKDYIAAGDIFQANLSLRVSTPINDVNPWSLYSVLRSINPSPFASFIDFGDYLIVGSSPERLLKVSEGVVETRPIAGTRPRGKNEKEDVVMRAELLLNEKERAEHIMLIDLERNDIGRVCDYGTVEADELMITEDYSHVIHIVSNIRGKLNRLKTPYDAIRAVFPGGTITGVPKVRCMEIIDELEALRRGPYTGSAGYIGYSGDIDLNIVIRSFTIKDGVAYVQAGAGIVADSDHLREYKESLKKAEALIKTLETIKKTADIRTYY